MNAAVGFNVINLHDQTYLCERGQNSLVLLQLKELADEVLFCETQRLQLTEDLFKYLQKHDVSMLSQCETRCSSKDKCGK